ncbi:alpha/beta hydrolase [Anaerolinea sp.]|uniref:alpha/beta hydrolase n=1 Tax=Anaerolinea sp. TaxID=1872519 RepID=UPI002ACEB4DB|nr:alpha/beta fold hydrolase [Anaerolinea sp.]
MNQPNPNLHNPHLNGEPFFWQAGTIGILMIHGFTATPVEVRMVAERLHPRGYTVAAPLLPGHGTHPDDLNRVRWQDWVAKAEESYQQLKQTCQKIYLLGESMGALVALYLAAEHRDAEGVIASAPAIRLQISPVQKAALPLISLFRASMPKGGLDASSNWQGYSVNPLKGVQQLFHFQKEVERRLPEIVQPILVLMGRYDTTVHPEVGRFILERVSSPCKSLVWFENSGHVILIDQEVDTAAERIERFIEENSNDGMPALLS